VLSAGDRPHVVDILPFPFPKRKKAFFCCPSNTHSSTEDPFTLLRSANLQEARSYSSKPSSENVLLLDFASSTFSSFLLPPLLRDPPPPRPHFHLNLRSTIAAPWLPRRTQKLLPATATSKPSPLWNSTQITSSYA